MYQYYIALCLLIATCNLHAQEGSLHDIRNRYKSSLENQKEAEALLKTLSGLDQKKPVLIAYKGATQALIAKLASVPTKKMNYLRKSGEAFDAALAKEPHNVEIRFLRFAVETNLPGFLKQRQRKKIEEDKKEIIEYLPQSQQYNIDKTFRKEIIDYLLGSDQCTVEEQKKLRAMLH